MVILRQTGNVIGVGGKYNNFIEKCSLPKIMVSFYSENFMNELIIRISFLVYLYKGKLYHLNKFWKNESTYLVVNVLIWIQYHRPQYGCI